eukprot:10537086-Ditylum_brightwellii.AAC.1
MKYIWLSNNLISGKILTEWNALDNLLMVALDHNKLSGPVSPVFGSWKTSYTFDQVPAPYCPTCALGN